MDKYLTYSVVERKDPQNPDVEGKYYAQAQARGEAGIRELSQRIQQMCTVTRADVMAVLIALEDVVSDSLSNGEIVRLGELGSLQVSLSGEGATTKDDYHDGLIQKAKILFRSGRTLSNMLTSLRYEKVEQKYKKEETEEPLP
ncbi:HU family DNA-binding protein [Bacteroides caecigallinarum]|uniref:HU family DNA-binding protein n=1 Tax=uncultured Bacteroides sp. TaxID=162156 RepID=UPI002598B356|nr:HU family DNA-binding protein [uncultured Bacteroides sp.]MDN0051601.1 HU family DNA-binding protein [Bacteroides caecigallinarum]MDN0071257.1 HU family DNA-binding protein [Bacteroides caecigallinarum]